MDTESVSVYVRVHRDQAQSSLPRWRSVVYPVFVSCRTHAPAAVDSSNALRPVECCCCCSLCWAWHSTTTAFLDPLAGAGLLLLLQCCCGTKGPPFNRSSMAGNAHGILYDSGSFCSCPVACIWAICRVWATPRSVKMKVCGQA